MAFSATDVRVVLFDMDGVLVDVSNSYRKAISETATHFLGREITLNAVNRYKNIGGYNDDWECTAAMLNDAGVKVPFDRIVREFQRRYRGDDWDGLIANEPAIIDEELLDELRAQGYILGVVTGRPKEEADWTINKFDWGDYFPLVVAKEQQDGRTKPDPFPIQKALAMLEAAGQSVPTDEVVYVGDSVDDMEAAVGAEVGPLGVVPPYDAVDFDDHVARLREAGAGYILEEINQLDKFLSGRIKVSTTAERAGA